MKSASYPSLILGLLISVSQSQSESEEVKEVIIVKEEISVAQGLDPRRLDSVLMTVFYWQILDQLAIPRSNLASTDLLSSLHLLKHLSTDVLSEFCFKLVLLNLADVSVVHTLPHDLQCFNLFTLLLPLPELLDATSDFGAQLGELLGLLECPISLSLGKVYKFPLLYFYEFVDFLGCCPEVTQVCTLRLQALVETSSCE